MPPMMTPGPTFLYAETAFAMVSGCRRQSPSIKKSISAVLFWAPVFLALEAPPCCDRRTSLQGYFSMMVVELSDEQSSTTTTSKLGYFEAKAASRQRPIVFSPL